MRRLTDDEWHFIRDNDCTRLLKDNFENPLAILDFPPSPPTNVLFPESIDDLSHVPLSNMSSAEQSVLPISTLIPSRSSFGQEPMMPNNQIPLYNVISLFPEKEHRQRLWQAMSRLFEVQEARRHRVVIRHHRSQGDQISQLSSRILHSRCRR